MMLQKKRLAFFACNKLDLAAWYATDDDDRRARKLPKVKQRGAKSWVKIALAL